MLRNQKLNFTSFFKQLQRKYLYFLDSGRLFTVVSIYFFVYIAETKRNSPVGIVNLVSLRQISINLDLFLIVCGNSVMIYLENLDIWTLKCFKMDAICDNRFCFLFCFSKKRSTPILLARITRERNWNLNFHSCWYSLQYWIQKKWQISGSSRMSFVGKGDTVSVYVRRTYIYI